MRFKVIICNGIQLQSIKMEHKGVKVTSMAISPDETWLVCAMENNQLIVFPFQNLDMVKVNEVPKDMNVQVSISFIITH